MPPLQESGLALLQKTELTSLAVASERTIYTVPTGKTCILHYCYVKFAGDPGDDGVFTIGQDGAETDWVAVTNTDNASAALSVLAIAPVPSATPPELIEYVAGEKIILDVSVAANAVTATVYLFGFLDDA